MDSLGRKQGHWIFYNPKGRMTEECDFLDGVPHGVKTSYAWADGHIFRQEFKLGKRQGYNMRYHRDSTVADVVSFYDADTFVWMAWPYEFAQYVIPIKGLSTHENQEEKELDQHYDTIRIRVPYVNGQLLHEGPVLKRKNKGIKPVSIHTTYFSDGRKRAVTNYDQKSITVFAADGKVEFQGSHQAWRLEGLRKTKVILK
jgi:prepilin-type processing-associated H-X9-DG protein